MKSSSHPSDENLSRWATDEADRRSSEHITHCPQCLERLEQLTELEPQLRAQLEATLDPGPTLEQRLARQLERRLADRETWSVMTDLMNTGIRTSRILIESHRSEDEHG